MQTVIQTRNFVLTLHEEIRELKTLLLVRGETANPAGAQQSPQ
jgi:hypothetical protein